MKKELGIFVLLVFLFAFTGWRSPNFLRPYNISNISGSVGIYGIFALGEGLVIITGGIDLTTGAIIALHGVILSALLVGYHGPYFGFDDSNPSHAFSWPVAVLLTILIISLLGVIHGLLIAKLRLQAFIVTLCGFLIYRGVARTITDDNPVNFLLGDAASVDQSFPMLHKLSSSTIQQMFPDGFFTNHFPRFAQDFSILLNLKMPFFIMLVIAGILWVLLHRSVYGRYLFAAGRNEDAARFSGIRTAMVIGTTYVLNMLLVSIGAVLFDVDTGSVQPSSHGMVLEMYAIAAAVLGGCSLRGGEGSIIGMVLGTILLVVLRNMVNLLNLPSSLDYVLTGGVILMAVTLDRILVIVGARRARRAAAAATAPVPVAAN